MNKELSHDQWMKVQPPFCILRIPSNIDKLDNQIITKICEVKTKGWWYREHDQIVFERKEDAVLVRLAMHSIRDNEGIISL